MTRWADRSSRERLVIVASDVLLVVAVVIATSPWTTGLYTWAMQQRMRSETGASAAGPRATSRTAGAPRTEREAVWDGWEREDARVWAATAEGRPLGRLRIPRLGLDVALVKGVSESDLRLGPGWVIKSSPPGPRGNTGISGHRTTYLAPFREIDRLSSGDVVTLETRWRTYTYRVTQRFFADPGDGDIMLPTAAPTLTLTSCHPPYSAQFRIVVQASLTKVVRR